MKFGVMYCCYQLFHLSIFYLYKGLFALYELYLSIMGGYPTHTALLNREELEVCLIIFPSEINCFQSLSLCHSVASLVIVYYYFFGYCPKLHASSLPQPHCISLSMYSHFCSVHFTVNKELITIFIFFILFTDKFLNLLLIQFFQVTT